MWLVAGSTGRQAGVKVFGQGAMASVETAEQRGHGLDRRLPGRAALVATRDPTSNPSLVRLGVAGRDVTAAGYLLAIEDLQGFSRVVARFLPEPRTAVTRSPPPTTSRTPSSRLARPPDVSAS